MQLGYRIANLWLFQRPLLLTTFTHRPKKFSSSLPSTAKAIQCVYDDCKYFLPWLEGKAGGKISSFLSIGKSAYGRSLFATKPIENGDCILKVPYSVQISPKNIPPEINALLDGVDNIAKLAILILVEQKLGKDSVCAPYISCLPNYGEMQNTVLHQFPAFFKDITLQNFTHLYSVVGSRAWGSTKGLSLIPFADFLNHDGALETDLLSDEVQQCSEVISDRSYAPGEQVLIRYGKFSNATLLLGFGFTHFYNIHDEVQIQLSIPHDDDLHKKKMELLQRYSTPVVKDVTNFKYSWDSFTIKEVRSSRGKGKGIPQSLRAFSRVLCCTSLDASLNDGRLAPCPFKSRIRELQAHQILLSCFTRLIEEHDASLKSIGHSYCGSGSEKVNVRRQMAHDLLTGELRVLKSAQTWLNNYCVSLSTTIA